MHAVSLRERPLAARFAIVTPRRTRSLTLTAPLSAEDCALQSMPDASPAKWHLAHTTWFFETFVLARTRRVPAVRRRVPACSSTRTTTASATRHPRPERGLLSRPTARPRCSRTARTSTRAMQALPRRAPLDAELAGAGRARPAPRAAAPGADPHRHQAPASSRNPLRPAYRAGAGRSTPVAPRRAALASPSPAASSTIGHAGDGFAFDNERPRAPRASSRRSRSRRARSRNGEFVAFIADGGYRRPELWLSQGWDAVRAQRLGGAAVLGRATARWHDVHAARAGRRSTRTRRSCHVSFFEADAYARWAGARLPTEVEWELGGARRAGRRQLRSRPARCIRCRAGSTRRRRAGAAVRRRVGVDRAAPTRPTPAIAPAAGARRRVQRQVHVQPVRAARRLVRDAAHRTSGRRYRNFFPPDARWQFSGIRLARDAQ